MFLKAIQGAWEKYKSKLRDKIPLETSLLINN